MIIKVVKGLYRMKRYGRWQPFQVQMDDAVNHKTMEGYALVSDMVNNELQKQMGSLPKEIKIQRVVSKQSN